MKKIHKLLIMVEKVNRKIILLNHKFKKLFLELNKNIISGSWNIKLTFLVFLQQLFGRFKTVKWKKKEKKKKIEEKEA